MTQVQKVKLRPWQEIVGKRIEAYMAEDKFVILIEKQPRKFKLSLPILVEDPKTFIGQTIGVIRTDRPFVIRIAKSTADGTIESATTTTTLGEETT
jgi:dihydropteroate synthase